MLSMYVFYVVGPPQHDAYKQQLQTHSGVKEYSGNTLESSATL